VKILNVRLQVQLPRKVLLPLCAALTVLAYYLVLFAGWANYHGGSPFQTVMTDGLLVVAAFSCLEVVRTERLLPIRAIAGAVGLPLVLVTLLVLWYGLRRYVAA
jgi:hypothetical protein